jgi:hypothetical protein
MTFHLKPSEIHFTHSNISDKFTGCGKSLIETLNEITTGTTKITDIPKIKVFYFVRDGKTKYISENNRRLWVFKQLEKNGIISEVEVRLEKTNNKKHIINTYSLESRVKPKVK